MKEVVYLLLILQINLVFPQNLEDLGDQIRRQVQESLQNTQNLGNIIGQNIRQQLLPLNNLHNSISDNIRNEMLPLQNLGSEIREKVRRNLLPVYAMRIKEDMKHGIGGKTVVTYDSGKTFIIENGQRYTCRGNIQRGVCNGVKTLFQISNREDYCNAPSFAEVNNNVCLSISSLNIYTSNNEFNCYASDESPVLILTKQEYRAMCNQASPHTANYKYYANLNDPSTIAIPNPNPHVTCLNNEPNVCEFQDAASRRVMSYHNSYSSLSNY